MHSTSAERKPRARRQISIVSRTITQRFNASAMGVRKTELAKDQTGALKMKDRKKQDRNLQDQYFGICRTAKCKTGKCRTGFWKTICFERWVHECFALFYERLWSFSSHQLSFWSSFFRSCIFQYVELVLHFPPVHFGPLFYLVLLIPVLHFQSTRPDIS